MNKIKSVVALAVVAVAGVAMAIPKSDVVKGNFDHRRPPKASTITAAEVTRGLRRFTAQMGAKFRGNCGVGPLTSTTPPSEPNQKMGKLQ